MILKDGQCVYAQYDGAAGIDSLLLAVADDLYYGRYTFVSEPESIDSSDCLFKKGIESLKSDCRHFYEDYLYSKKFAPPDYLRVCVDVASAKNAKNITRQEFHILTVVSEFNKISDIIKNSKINETKAVMALVSLRKKKLIRVYEEVKR